MPANVASAVLKTSPIQNSVGLGGLNNLEDVKLIQIVINFNIGKLVPLSPLVADGHAGPKTFGAIKEARLRLAPAAPGQTPSKIEPTDSLLGALQAAIPDEFSAEILSAIMPRASQALIDRYAPVLASAMDRANINSPLRKAHFLAQLAHESGQLRYAEELADGSAYEGRKDLGNTQPGDGKLFKGRGLIQITGRTNYAAYSKYAGKDYVAQPRLLATSPGIAVDCSCWYWTSRDLNKLADADDAVMITRRINGGTNGLSDRMRNLARAKYMLKC